MQFLGITDSHNVCGRAVRLADLTPAAIWRSAARWRSVTPPERWTSRLLSSVSKDRTVGEKPLCMRTQPISHLAAHAGQEVSIAPGRNRPGGRKCNFVLLCGLGYVTLRRSRLCFFRINSALQSTMPVMTCGIRIAEN